MNTEQDSLDWVTGREGRSSEVCRRMTFLVFFTLEGRPRYRLLLLGILCGLVAVLGFSD
ncbi:MAG: hypothetical protein JWP08_341 [Bryobacterales bacterium]|nr:hypothetical protein [Bryobacterales bacterium]